MKQVFRYYLTAIFSSLAFFIWVAVMVFCFILPIFLRYDGIVESYLMRPLLRSQSVLYTIWAFIILQGGYWCAHLAYDRKTSGLSVWWTAEGLTPFRQFAGLFMACLVPCVAFISIGLGFLLIVSSLDRAIPVSLLLEQAFLMILAAVLYCQLAILLGSVLNPTLALILSVSAYVFALKGLIIARTVATGFPEPFRKIASCVLFMIPNLDLYFRPGAVIHFWPLLPPPVWAGVFLYTLLWSAILALISKRALRPCLT